MKPMRTSRGREYTVLGDRSVLTMDRLSALEDRLDSDPRIASISVVAHIDRSRVLASNGTCGLRCADRHRSPGANGRLPR